MKSQSNFPQLATNRLLELSEVTHITTLKKTAIYKLIKLGEIKPIKLGRKTVFLESEIQNWISTRVSEFCNTIGAF